MNHMLNESKKDTIVMTFGRFSPPTSGHELLVKTVLLTAAKYNADHVIFASRTQDAVKNPLTVKQKVAYMRHSFKGANIVGADDNIRTFLEAAKYLSGKYRNLIMVAGSDRVIEYTKILNKYNGKDFSFEKILVVSAGERDPDSDGASGMSATKMRKAAAEGNFAKFKQGVPSTMSTAMAKRMFNDVRFGLSIRESSDELYSRANIFNVGDVVMHNGVEKRVALNGTNYVILEDGSRAWVTSVHRVNEATHQDKLKAAKVIAIALGYTDVEDKTDPTQIINLALKKSRTKHLTPQAKAIIIRMLGLASKLGVKYDQSLAPVEREQTNEDVATADYKLTKSGRKYKRVVRIQGSDREDTDDYIEGEGKWSDKNESIDYEQHHLMVPTAKKGEYERRRRINLKMHEEFDEEIDEDDIVNSITDDDIADHCYEDDEFEVIDEDTNEVIELDESSGELNEVLSRIERIKAKAKMRRSAAKRQRAARIALKRKSAPAVLAKRARRLAVKALERRLARKPLNKLSVSEKERIEARIKKMTPTLNRLAIKMLPKVKAFEAARLSHRK